MAALRLIVAITAISFACKASLLHNAQVPDLVATKEQLLKSQVFQEKVKQACGGAEERNRQACASGATEGLFCQLLARQQPELAKQGGCHGDAVQARVPSFVQLQASKGPEDDLAQEMTHDLEMNFNKIAPFGKEDTAKELQDHAAKTQDTLVDAVENAEVAEIKRAVFRALTRLRAATIKEFDTIARLETQAIDAYNDAHHYRAENPLAHLHEDEAPVETDKLKSFH